MKVEGEIYKKTVGKKSKTEYDALFIKTGRISYVLRQPGQSPFKNPELEKLIGKKIKAEGELVKDIFFITKWELDED
ncbi:MAG: hypothetical protein ACKVOW_18655 [Chitinophagaceae bacterium]